MMSMTLMVGGVLELLVSLEMGVRLSGEEMFEVLNPIRTTSLNVMAKYIRSV